MLAQEGVMSALGGICSFNGAVVDEAVLVALANRLSDRGPDGGREVLFKTVGMVYRAFHTNRESRLETQPLVSPSRHLLSWDGRLDNRGDMISQLRDDLRGDHTDVAIVMAAYLKWGLDFLPRIIGDFVLSLWDPHTRMLLLARDPIGPRTLYYHANSERIIWSTQLGPLLDLAKIKLEINDEYIAEFLTRLPEPSQTPYKNIYAAPPGNTVIAQNGQLRVQRFWGLDPKHEIRYRTDAQYEEHFRHLFREAVRCRLRVEGPAWSELSGGLDSSSIVCMADDIMKGVEAQASRLETVSLVFDEASKSDERKYIRHVEEKIGRTGFHLREDDFRMLAPSTVDHQAVIPNPTYIFAEYYRGLSNTMREKGARVLLSGKGGDEILSSAPNPAPELADLLIQCKLGLLLTRVQDWSRALKKPYLWLLWYKAVVPTLPRRLQAVYSRGTRLKSLELYNDEFVKRLNLRERRSGSSDIFGFRYLSGRDQSMAFLSIVRELSAGYWLEWGIEISYPFVDRRLVEFMQAIPYDQRVRPGETRSLLRRALRNLLPEEIAKRKRKTLNTAASFLAVSREWSRLSQMLLDARVCTYGYANSEAMLAALDRARAGRDPSSLSITFLISLEIWLRALERKDILANRRAATTVPPVNSETIGSAKRNQNCYQPKVVA